MDFKTPKNLKRRQEDEAQALKLHHQMNKLAGQKFENCDAAIKYNYRRGNIGDETYHDAKHINHLGNLAKHDWN